MDSSKIVPPLKLLLRRDSAKSVVASPPYDKPSTSRESTYAPDSSDQRKTESKEVNLPAIENEAADIMHETEFGEAEVSPIECLKRINNSQADQLIKLYDVIDKLRRKCRDQDAKVNTQKETIGKLQILLNDEKVERLREKQQFERERKTKDDEIAAGKNFNDYLQRALEREKTARQLDKQSLDNDLANLKEEHTHDIKKCELEKEKILVLLSQERQKINTMARSEWEFGQRIAREHMNSGMPLFLEGFIRGALEHPSLANILAANGQIPVSSSIPSTSTSADMKVDPENRKRGGAASEVSDTKGKKIKSEIDN